jgi:hypothetical protein
MKVGKGSNPDGYIYIWEPEANHQKYLLLSLLFSMLYIFSTYITPAAQAGRYQGSHDQDGGND